MDKLDIKLWTLASKGQIVPDRSLLKTPEQIEAIKKSAELNTAVLDHVAAHIHAGMSTAEIDKLVYDFTTEHGGIPAPLNYEGFPKSVCTSINNVICHGIPSENEIIIDGDIINVDVSTILNGYFSDASRMFMIGNVSPEAERIVRVTKECVELGLKAAKPWGHLGDIAYAINLHIYSTLASALAVYQQGKHHEEEDDAAEQDAETDTFVDDEIGCLAWFLLHHLVRWRQ